MHVAEFGWSLGARRIRRRDAPSGEAALQLVDDGVMSTGRRWQISRHRVNIRPLRHHFHDSAHAQGPFSFFGDSLFITFFKEPKEKERCYKTT